MKKTLLGGVVGGLIIFIWQAISHMAFNLHEPSQKYSPGQDSVLIALKTHIKNPGGYILPRMKDELSMDQMESFTQSIQGKPWAIIRYYDAYEVDMLSNMLRGAVVNILLAILLIWIIKHLKNPTRGLIIRLSIVVGFMAFANVAYTEHIWYPVFDLRAQLIDAVVGWALCGIWLGWLFKRKI
ncbi:hypothetical protein [Aquirufa sp.]|jgi:hypothetical protein|uniref:hypothetical protein n=1 Tax=Aquirufa sp. TaxID=2676249 RepID=UPI0037BF6005